MLTDRTQSDSWTGNFLAIGNMNVEFLKRLFFFLSYVISPRN